MSPYLGSFCHIPPLVLWLNSRLALHSIAYVIPNLLFDAISAQVLRSLASRVLHTGQDKAPSALQHRLLFSPDAVMGLFFLNPFSIVSCVSGSTSPLETVLVLAAAWRAAAGDVLGAAAAGAAGAYVGLHPLLLALPLALLAWSGPEQCAPSQEHAPEQQCVLSQQQGLSQAQLQAGSEVLPAGPATVPAGGECQGGHPHGEQKVQEQAGRGPHEHGNVGQGHASGQSKQVGLGEACKPHWTGADGVQERSAAGAAEGGGAEVRCAESSGEHTVSGRAPTGGASGSSGGALPASGAATGSSPEVDALPDACTGSREGPTLDRQLSGSQGAVAQTAAGGQQQQAACPRGSWQWAVLRFLLLLGLCLGGLVVLSEAVLRAQPGAGCAPALLHMWRGSECVSGGQRGSCLAGGMQMACGTSSMRGSSSGSSSCGGSQGASLIAGGDGGGLGADSGGPWAGSSCSWGGSAGGTVNAFVAAGHAQQGGPGFEPASPLLSQCWAVSVYRLPLLIEDQTPNIGQMWYFFTELFANYRPFFRFVVHSLPVLFVVPLALRFPRRPILLLTCQCLVNCLFKPYPSAADHALFLALLPLLQPQLQRLKTGMLMVNSYLLLWVLEPAMWRQWILVESANSNFYYSITLLLGAWQVLLLVQLLLASVQLELHAKRGDKQTPL